MDGPGYNYASYLKIHLWMWTWQSAANPSTTLQQ